MCMMSIYIYVYICVYSVLIWFYCKYIHWEDFLQTYYALQCSTMLLKDQSMALGTQNATAVLGLHHMAAIAHGITACVMAGIRRMVR